MIPAVDSNVLINTQRRTTPHPVCSDARLHALHGLGDDGLPVGCVVGTVGTPVQHAPFFRSAVAPVALELDWWLLLFRLGVGPFPGQEISARR